MTNTTGIVTGQRGKCTTLPQVYRIDLLSEVREVGCVAVLHLRTASLRLSLAPTAAAREEATGTGHRGRFIASFCADRAFHYLQLSISFYVPGWLQSARKHELSLPNTVRIDSAGGPPPARNFSVRVAKCTKIAHSVLMLWLQYVLPRTPFDI